MNIPAELRHWFFQTLNPEQRKGFLVAAGIAPKSVELSLNMQYQAIERIACRLSPTPETGLLRDALETIKEHLDNDENFLAWEAANEALSNVSRLED